MWLLFLILSQLTRRLVLCEQSQPVSVLFVNGEADARELYWLSAKGPVLLSRLEGKSQQEILTFVGHELGWQRERKSCFFNCGLALEGQFVVESGTARVTLADARASLPEPVKPRDLFQEELEAVWNSLDLDPFASMKNATRKAYYVVDVSSNFLLEFSSENNHDEHFFAEKVTTFGKHLRRLDALAFVDDSEAFILLRRDDGCGLSVCGGRLFYDFENHRRNWLSFTLTTSIPSLSSLLRLEAFVDNLLQGNHRFLLEEDVTEEKKKLPFVVDRRRRKRILVVGCSPEATLLAVKVAANRTEVHCIDDNASNRKRAVADAKRQQAKLYAKTHHRGLYDLVIAEVFDDHKWQHLVDRQPSKRVWPFDREKTTPILAYNESHRFLQDDAIILLRSPSKEPLQTLAHDFAHVLLCSFHSLELLTCSKTNPPSSRRHDNNKKKTFPFFFQQTPT